MFEFRVVDNGPTKRPDFRYRYQIFTTNADGALCPPDPNNMWSEWKDVEWVRSSGVEYAD